MKMNLNNLISIREMIAEACMQGAVTLYVRLQLLYLVGENSPAFEINVFGIVGRKWHRDEFH